ncbi:DNA methyltransferase [Nonomuraea sp. NBC_01738]|uniref:DNA methyltransferase n=1 Tax=Nonomuraea sp. NBC_01738 TaxID=2976003 RepID=UPI002E0E0C2F|nr:DNA methyltransferase [Nonomuraea sp. NBC_01738]
MTEELNVGRSDPAYMAHAYLTKVPVPAIIPFIETHTQPGQIVLDPFAGSGMTGVAAAMTGRSARLFDISVLGQHIGSNFVNLVDGHLLSKHAAEVVEASQKELGDVYKAQCRRCKHLGHLVKTVWTILVRCRSCGESVNYYRAMEAANWVKPDMVCQSCSTSVSSRDPRVGEEPVLDYLDCQCQANQVEQDSMPPQTDVDIESLPYPRVEITPDRQMYKASALGKSGLTTVASFYSTRNLAVLTTLREQIRSVADDSIRRKLLFAFTACLTRASKRYQWSRQRPLNAANANYYVAPVFYEWNVYELFLRKVTAVARSDEWVAATRSTYVEDSEVGPDVEYGISSAENIPLPDNSIDYVFTDPPFGSNLFYADMALFQEAWLDGFSNVEEEAVVDRSRGGKRSASRYEGLITAALSECNRVVRPGGSISMVFGNSSGQMWALVQRSIRNAKLAIVPESLTILNKGQRSVKGLASGFEHVATLDLITTMVAADGELPPLTHVPDGEVARLVRGLAENNQDTTPSHLYLELLRTAIRNNWMVDELNLSAVTEALIEDGWTVQSKTGRLRRKGDSDELSDLLPSPEISLDDLSEEFVADPLFS